MSKKMGRKVSSIVLGSSMLILSMLPAASAFAQSAPSVTLKGSTITAQPGATVTYTATAANVTNPEYQFWVENPNGSWVDAQNYSSNGTFQLKNVQSGNYLVAVEVMTSYQVQHGEWSDALTPLADGVFVDSAVKLSTSSTTAVEGQNITVSAAATNIFSPLYQFWYETPSGQWVQSGNYTSSNTFTFKADATGTYHVIGYAKSPLGVNDPEGALSSNVLAPSVQAAVSAVTVTGLSDMAAGNGAALTATATENGTAITSPTSVSWTVTSSNGTAGDVAFSAPGSLSTSLNVPASDPGTYLVTATVDGVPSAPFKVVAYGQASAVTEKASSSTVIADGKDTDTITAIVTDANGNAVANYHGTATIMISNAAVTLATGTSQQADVSGSTVTFSGGTATFTVQAGSVPGETAAVSLSGLTAAVGTSQATSVTYGPAASISAVPQSATAVTVTPVNKTVSVNTNAVPDTVNVTVDDQAGFPMLGGTYALHATVAGGATFTGSATSEALYASGDPASTSLTIYGTQGITGTYAVSVGGTGLATGTGEVAAVITSVPADLTATDSTPSFTEGGAGTTVTLGAADASGDVVALPSTVIPEVTITNAAGAAVTGLTVTPNSGSAVVSGTVYTLPAGTASFTITDMSGKADAGTYTVTVRDGESTDTLASAQTSVTELAGNASAFALTPATNVLDGSHLSTTLDIQVTDAYGNPVATQAVPVSVAAQGTAGAASLNGGAYSLTPSVTAETDASGTAQVTFSAEDYTGTWTVTAGIAAGALGTGSSALTDTTSLYVQNHPTASYSFKLEDVTSGTYANSTSYAQAGNTVIVTPALLNAGLDANNNPVPSSVDQTDTVSVTIAHASGLLGLPTTGAGVNVTADSADDTETYTGTLSNVSALLGSATLTAGKSGEVTVSIQDSSTGASGSASIDVNASTVPSAISLSGISTAEVLSANTAYPVTVSLTDAGGNPIMATASQTVVLAVSGVVAENTVGAPITSVSIPAGQSSASVMIVTPQSGTFTGGSVTATDSTQSLTAGTATGLSD